MGMGSEALGTKAGASGHLSAGVPNVGAPEGEGTFLTVPEGLVQELQRMRGYF